LDKAGPPPGRARERDAVLAKPNAGHVRLPRPGLHRREPPQDARINAGPEHPEVPFADEKSEDRAALEIVEIVSHTWIESSRRADSGNGG
jgi:hypothetical protein